MCGAGGGGQVGSVRWGVGVGVEDDCLDEGGACVREKGDCK